MSKGEFILARGSKDINVMLLQQRLQALGCFKGTINGIFDTFTESAINEYKDKVGLWNFGAYRGKVGNGSILYSGHTMERVGADLAKNIDKTKENIGKENCTVYIVKIK